MAVRRKAALLMLVCIASWRECWCASRFRRSQQDIPHTTSLKTKNENQHQLPQHYQSNSVQQQKLEQVQEKRQDGVKWLQQKPTQPDMVSPTSADISYEDSHSGEYEANHYNNLDYSYFSGEYDDYQDLRYDYSDEDIRDIGIENTYIDEVSTDSSEHGTNPKIRATEKDDKPHSSRWQKSEFQKAAAVGDISREQKQNIGEMENIYIKGKSIELYPTTLLPKYENRFENGDIPSSSQNMVMNDDGVRNSNLDDILRSPSFPTSSIKDNYSGDYSYHTISLEEFVDHFLGDFNLGKFSRSKCNLQNSERSRRKLKELLRMCTNLKEDSGLGNFLSQSPDVKDLGDVTSRISHSVDVISGLSVSSSDCHLLPFNQTKFLANIILHGEKYEKSMSTILDTLHHMILGHSDYFASQSLLSLIAKRLQFRAKQSKRWYLEAIFSCLTLLQIGGSAALMSALNIEKKSVSDRIAPFLLNRLRQQSQQFAKIVLEIDDTYVNHEWDNLSVFHAKRSQDVLISLDAGVVGIDENKEMFTLNSARNLAFHNIYAFPTVYPWLNKAENADNYDQDISRFRKAGRKQNKDVTQKNPRMGARQKKFGDTQEKEREKPCSSLPDLEDRKLSFIKGCQLIMKRGGILALRCNVVQRHNCQGEFGIQELVSNDVYLWHGSRGMISESTSKRRKCSPAEKLSCIDTTWISSNDTSQTICAVKLRVMPDSSCLSLGVYFCAKNSCTHSNQGWLTESFSHKGTTQQYWHEKSQNVTHPITTGSYETKIDSRLQEWWSSDVDSHMVMPEMDGWLSGMRLYSKGGRLAIALKTSF